MMPYLLQGPLQDYQSRYVRLSTFTPPDSTDSTAPVLSSPTSSDIQNTTVDLGVTTDEGNGTLYWFISTSATPPSATDLKAGTGATASGTQAVSTSGAQSVNDAGTLAAGTSYYAHMLHTDASDNDSNIVTTAQFTTTNADVTAPTVTSVTTAVNGTDIEINCNEAVAVGSGGNGGFTLNASGGAVTLTFDSILTNAIFYTTSRTIGSHETLTLDYVQPGNGIEDSAGNDLASFTGQSVSNNSNVDTVAPTLSSASVTTSGTTLTMVFDENVNVGSGGNGGFVATMSGGASALTYSSGDGTNTLVYTWARTIAESETGTLAYTQPGNGIEDDSGNDLVTFSGTTIVNTVAGVVQSNQQANIRAQSGTTLDYNSDFITLMKSDLSVTSGTFNELLILWLQDKMSSSTTNLQSLKAEAAIDRGVSKWEEISDPTAIGS